MKPDIESFYHRRSGLAPEETCSGLACYVARRDDAGRWRESSAQSVPVYCLGKCYRAPARAADTERPSVAFHSREAVIVRNLGDNATPALEPYRSRGGYGALSVALQRTPEEIIQTVEASELRGRGGAAYPTGRKWRAVFQQATAEKYVVANADEGDPGAYIGRFIVEDNPHSVIEALVIAGYAVGARRGYITSASSIQTRTVDSAKRSKKHGKHGCSVLRSSGATSRLIYTSKSAVAAISVAKRRRSSRN